VNNKVVFDGLLSSLYTLKEIPPDEDFMFVTTIRSAGETCVNK